MISDGISLNLLNRKGEVVKRFEPTDSMSDVEEYVKNLVEKKD